MPELFGSPYILPGLIAVVLLLLLLLLLMARSKRKSAAAAGRAAGSGERATGGKPGKADKRAAAEAVKAERQAAEEAAKAQKQAQADYAKAQKQAAKQAKKNKRSGPGAGGMEPVEMGPYLDYSGGEPDYGEDQAGYEAATPVYGAAEPQYEPQADMTGAPVPPPLPGFDATPPEAEPAQAESRVEARSKKRAKGGGQAAAPAGGGVLPAFDPVQTVLADILQGWGDLTPEDTNRLDVFRPEKVLPAIGALEIPRELKNSDYARARLIQLRRYAANLERGDYVPQVMQHEFAGMAGEWRPPTSREGGPESAGPREMEQTTAQPVEAEPATGEPAQEEIPRPPVAEAPSVEPEAVEADAEATAVNRETGETELAEPEAVETEVVEPEVVEFESSEEDRLDLIIDETGETAPEAVPDTAQEWPALAGQSDEEAVAAAAAAFWSRPEGRQLAGESEPAAPATAPETETAAEPGAAPEAAAAAEVGEDTEESDTPTEEQEAPFPDEQAVEEEAAHEPALEEQVEELKEAVVEEPVTEEAAVEAPVTETPVAEEPGGVAEETPARSSFSLWGPSEERAPRAQSPAARLDWEPAGAAEDTEKTKGAGDDDFLQSLRGKISTAAGLMALPPHSRGDMLPFLETAELRKVFQAAEDSALKLSVIDTLESIGTPGALDVIHSCLDDPDPQVQIHALDAADRLLSSR